MENSSAMPQNAPPTRYEAIELLVAVRDSSVTDSGHCSICLADPHSPGCVIELVEKLIHRDEDEDHSLPPPQARTTLINVSKLAEEAAMEFAKVTAMVRGFMGHPAPNATMIAELTRIIAGKFEALAESAPQEAGTLRIALQRFVDSHLVTSPHGRIIECKCGPCKQALEALAERGVPLEETKKEPGYILGGK